MAGEYGEQTARVALLAEDVDRNSIDTSAIIRMTTPSPSSRRTWIEILLVRVEDTVGSVALLAEDVDRNLKRLRKAYKGKVALLAEDVDRNRLCP